MMKVLDSALLLNICNKCMTYRRQASIWTTQLKGPCGALLLGKQYTITEIGQLFIWSHFITDSISEQLKIWEPEIYTYFSKSTATQNQNVQRWDWSETFLIWKGRRNYRSLYFKMSNLANSDERHTLNNQRTKTYNRF